MTMDKSLRVRKGASNVRGVLTHRTHRETQGAGSLGRRPQPTRAAQGPRAEDVDEKEEAQEGRGRGGGRREAGGEEEVVHRGLPRGRGRMRGGGDDPLRGPAARCDDLGNADPFIGGAREGQTGMTADGG